MYNDLIRLAMERACRAFAHKGGHVFNAANFSSCFCALAGTTTPLDGLVVRAMLAGRSDVVPLGDGCHYEMCEYVMS